MTESLESIATNSRMEDVVSVVVDLEGDDALVDIVRSPRSARRVIDNLHEQFPDRPIISIFGIDIMQIEVDDEAHIIRGEN
jgi:hypothetical protein